MQIKYSVIIPCYNEGHVIDAMVRKTHQLMSRFYEKNSYEIIVVDDGSTDNSAQKIKDVAESHVDVTTIINHKNSGKGSVVKQGFDSASGTHLLFIDGDLDIDPLYIVEFFRLMESDSSVDVLIGSKYCDESIAHVSFKRKVFSRVYRIINKVLFGLSVEDTQMGIKAMKSCVWDVCGPQAKVTGYAFDIELLSNALRAGFTLEESPVDIVINPEESHITKRSIIKMLADTLQVYRHFLYRDLKTMLSFSEVRMRLFSARR